MADSEGSMKCDGNQNTQGTDINALIKEGFEALMPAIRVSNSLPKEQKWDLFCSSPYFKPNMDSLGTKALDLMAMILHNQGLYRDIKRRDLEEKYELVVEANDKVLERVGMHLDELSGIRRNPTENVPDMAMSLVSSASGSWNKDVRKSAAWKEVTLSKESNSPKVLRIARITQRPQVKFLDKIDNSSTPFEPRIKEKPNALKPLAILLEALPGEEECFSHPYEFELDRFQEKIPSMDLNTRKPQKPKPTEEIPLIIITKEEQLQDLLSDLVKQTEIAVDLEHHSYRSFQGFTCLMQISTREKDYIIDTLELRHKLYILNEVFSNPKIVKVFHGADSDIQWLQRDLCLYVVNMFDTYQAALLLSLPRLSLAYLLKTFCNVDANKHFQLYDWRTRPLAKEAIKYAREDTHYLLYIFDLLWNQLIGKANMGTQLLQSVLYRSADTCKKRYWKPIFKEDSYENMYRHSKKNFDNRQMYALVELYKWRDKTAREEDESLGYVLPNHMLLLISEQLPKEMQGILACCNPIPPLLRQNLVSLHQVILKAREQPLVIRANTGMNKEARARSMPQTTVNLESALHCPHDLTYNVDFRDDMPTLLNNTSIGFNCNVQLLKNQPEITVFEEKKELKDISSKMNLPNQVYFMSPIERYRKMLSFLEEDEKKSKEDKEQEALQDTQKLLDECARDIRRQNSSMSSANASFDAMDIKQENENGNQHSKKRSRSEDSPDEDGKVGDDHEVSIKTEMTLNESSKPFPKSVKHKKYKNLLNKVNQKNQTIDKEQNSSLAENPSQKSQQPGKKQTQQVQRVVPMDVGATHKSLMNQKGSEGNPFKKKKISENVLQYDYSSVDYNQFQNSDTFNARNSKNASQDRFKPKGKKKQQNKSFTFARQYGRNNQKKP